MSDLEKAMKSIGESCKDLCKNLEKNSLQIENARLKAEVDSQICKIEEMQSHIDCLKAELNEVQTQEVDLPAEPIKVADMKINKGREVLDFTIIGEINTRNIVISKYSVSDLREIAEHLLAYCNNNEEK